MAVILSVAAVVIGLFIVLVATRPAAYRVERKIELAAQPERVFALLGEVKAFGSVFVLFGEPWDKPSMHKTIEAQSVSWTGNGAGKMTIEEAVPARKVGIRLEYTEPMKSIANYVFTLEPSSVTATMTGTHNFVGKAFGLFMNMDKMLGADLEKTLAQVKLAAEKPA